MIKKLTPQDIKLFVALLAVFKSVFEIKENTNASEAYLSDLLAKKDFAVWTASIDNQIIGGLTIYILPQYHSPKNMAYLYDIAVLNEYQRQGIGQQLVSNCKDWCVENAIDELFLQAEKEDEQALNFYRKTGAAELHTSSFDYTI